MGLGLTACVVLSIIFCHLDTEAEELCGPSPCPYNSYCFRGTALLCIACNAACDECTGPGADECIRCKLGYYPNAKGSCVQSNCPQGTYGVNCNVTCHCLDPISCDPFSGLCRGKCEKGYYAPSDCMDQCPDGTYGLDCLEQCHCLNDSVCDKVLGFCPGNLCHPDWTSVGCSKRLPKLAFPPEVVVAGCTYLTVRWLSWKEDTDFGDLPVRQYRLYESLNSTDPPVWTEVVRIMHNSSRTSYTVNVTSLQGDAFYGFRVDVHYDDDGKVVERTSRGIESKPALVPCTTTTQPPSVTVPINQGSKIFGELESTNLAGGVMEVTWTFPPDLRRFTWNVGVQYRKVGIGNCQLVSGGSVTVIPVDQNQTTFRLTNPEPWSRYEITVIAQGNGSVSAVNGSQTIETISAETAPTGVVSSLQAEVQSHSATLSWTDVPCPQRGGVLVQYDVIVEGAGDTARRLVTNATSLNLEGLNPYTLYSVRVQYVNSVGPGVFSPPFNFTTLEDVPDSVAITSVVSSSTTIAVYFQPPSNTHGVLVKYQIQYSHTPEFYNPESLTSNASTPGIPVIRRLTPYTDYYVRVRAATNAGYGPFGNVTITRTLQALPFPPPRLLSTILNTSCIGVLWDPPDTSTVPVSAYVLQALVVKTGLVAWSVQLAFNVTQYTQCDLQPATAYNVTIRSIDGSNQGTHTWTIFTTEQLDPPQPRPPLLVNVSTTTAAVQLFALTTGEGFAITAYQVEVEWLVSRRRRKRHDQVPGATVAQLTPSEVGESFVLVIGDGNTYGGFFNDPLLPNQTYDVYFVVLSTLNNLTKFSYSRMAAPFTTLTPTTTPALSDGVEDWVWGIIGTLVIIISITITISLRFLWKARFKDEEKSAPSEKTSSNKTSNPEKDWIKTVTNSEGCNEYKRPPDSQPVGMQPNLKQEFKTLQAMTRVAEQHQDHSRVEFPSDSHITSLSINAIYMSAYKRQRAYIAAKSPYSALSAVDFWRLIHQKAIKTVVMITSVAEDKYTQYWLHPQVTIGRYQLDLLNVTEYADFTVYDISVREDDKQLGHVVRLYKFTSWPDHGVPEDTIPFLDMRHKVRWYHGDDAGPILVLSKTGVSRTGVFVAVDSLIDQRAAEGECSLFSCVRNMRKERPLAVRNFKQYAFINEAVNEQFQAGETIVNTDTLKSQYYKWTQRNSETKRSHLQDQFQFLQSQMPGPEKIVSTTALLPVYPVFVDGFRRRNQFILTRMPWPTTIMDFWRIVHKYRVQTIVAMDKHQDQPDPCPEYWASSDASKHLWGPFLIETTATFKRNNVTIRDLKLEVMEHPRDPPLTVRQFQVNVLATDRFIPVSKAVRDHQESSESPDSPILVHCEDGATHSGLFVALSLLCERMEEEREVDVYHTIKHIKRRCPKVIDDYDQFQLCYKALVDYMNLPMPLGPITETLHQNKTEIETPGQNKTETETPGQNKTETETLGQKKIEQNAQEQNKTDKTERREGKKSPGKSKRKKSSTVAPMPSCLNWESGSINITCSATTKRGREIGRDGVLQCKTARGTSSSVSEASSVRVRPRPCDVIVVPTVFSLRSRCTGGEVIWATGDLCVTPGPDCHRAVKALREGLGLCDVGPGHR